MKDENKTIIVNTPTEMIQAAISSGADLEKVEKLLDIQMKWEANEARKAYHMAMAKFGAVEITIDKDQKVGYSTSKGNVGYSHASLANAVRRIKAELCKHGLSATWRTKQNGKIIVTCKVTHEKGHFEETSLEADADATGSKNPIQAMGSAITYLERYTLLALTGIATGDQEDDGNSASGSVVSEAQLSTMLDILDNVPKSKENKATFLKFMFVDNFESIKASDYNKGMKALKALESRIAKDGK